MAAAEKKPPIDEARARELLQEARERFEAELKQAERAQRDEREQIADEVGPDDDPPLIEEKAVDDALAAGIRRQLAAIERAEKRLADGSYGFSIESGEPIPKKRLEAVPWAERTKEEEER